ADYFEKSTDVGQMKPKEAIAYHLRNLKKEYKESNLQGLMTCLKTLRIYLQNAHDHPTEKKYHKIKFGFCGTVCSVSFQPLNMEIAVLGRFSACDDSPVLLTFIRKATANS
ncbi:hypothetical protein FOZ62_006641, partial [Perkinsus olseni]